MSEINAHHNFALLARRMLSDYDAKVPGSLFGEGLRLSIADAFKLQTAVTRLREQRGEKVVGYKIGCVAPVNQRNFGVEHPVWGRLWSTEQHADGAPLKKNDFFKLAIEGEYAIKLNRDVDPDDCSIDSIVRCVGSVVPVIELHNVRFSGEPPNGHELIANNAIHAGVVAPRGVENPHRSFTTDLALLFDGEVVDSWKALEWPGEILESVPWLATTLAENGEKLKSGDSVLTGAFGPPVPLNEHRKVAVVSSDFGRVEATFR